MLKLVFELPELRSDALSLLLLLARLACTDCAAYIVNCLCLCCLSYMSVFSELRGVVQELLASAGVLMSMRTRSGHSSLLVLAAVSMVNTWDSD